MKKMIWFSILVNMMAFAVISIEDAITEFITFKDVHICSYIIIPTACLAYIIFMIRFKQNEETFGGKFRDKMIWLVVTAAFTYIVSYLIDLGFWIPQTNGTYLDGIEYPIAYLELLVIGISFFIIFDSCYYMMRFVESRKGEK